MSPELVRLSRSHSALTSGSVGILSEQFGVPGEPSAALESDVRHTVAAREFADPQSPATWVFEFKESTRAPSFRVNVFLTTAGEAAIVNSFKGHVDCLFHVTDRPEFRHVTFRDLVVAQGPPQESWTIPTWSLLTGSGSLQEALADLADIAEGIGHLVLPHRSPELIALARRAVAGLVERADEDMQDWANRLAGDVSDAND